MKKTRERDNPIHLKIRVVKIGGPATPQEIAYVLRQASRMGVHPAGWTIRAVNWEHPNRTGSGGVGDLKAFAALIGYHADDLQISPVKRTR